MCADSGPPAATEDKVPSSTASVDGDKPSVDGDKPSVDGDKPSVDGDKPPPAPVDGDKPPAASSSTTAAAAEAEEDSSTKSTAEGDTTSLDAPAVAAVADQQPQIISVPELPDATANAFTQLVLCR